MICSIAPGGNAAARDIERAFCALGLNHCSGCRGLPRAGPHTHCVVVACFVSPRPASCQTDVTRASTRHDAVVNSLHRHGTGCMAVLLLRATPLPRDKSSQEIGNESSHDASPQADARSPRRRESSPSVPHSGDFILLVYGHAAVGAGAAQRQHLHHGNVRQVERDPIELQTQYGSGIAGRALPRKGVAPTRCIWPMQRCCSVDAARRH